MLRIACAIVIGVYIVFTFLEFKDISDHSKEVDHKASSLDLKSSFGIRQTFLNNKYIGTWKIVLDKKNDALHSTEGVARVFFTWETEIRKNKHTGKDYTFFYNWIHLYLYDPLYSNEGFVSIVQPVRFKKLGILKNSLTSLYLSKILKENSRTKINFVRSYHNHFMSFTENAHYTGQVDFKKGLITSKGLNVTALMTSASVLEGSFTAKTDYPSFSFNVHYEGKPVYDLFRYAAWLFATTFVLGILGSLIFLQKVFANPIIATQTSEVMIIAQSIPLFFVINLKNVATGFNETESVFLKLLAFTLVVFQSLILPMIVRRMKTFERQENIEANAQSSYCNKYTLFNLLLLYVAYKLAHNLFWRPEALILLTGFCLTPQVIHNIIKKHDYVFEWPIPFFVGLSKYIINYFFFLGEDNLMRFEPFPLLCPLSLGIYIFSLIILHLQDHNNPNGASLRRLYQPQNQGEINQNVPANQDSPNNANASFANSEDRPVLTDSESIDNTCSLCFSSLETKDDLLDLNSNGNSSGVTVTACNHTFHTACLSRWKEVNDDCPKCKAALKAE